VSRELPALPLFAILLFHWHAKTSTSESRLPSPQASEKENKRSESQGVLKNTGELFTPAWLPSIPYACRGLKAQTQKANCPD
jgi:hypothetical protein